MQMLRFRTEPTRLPTCTLLVIATFNLISAACYTAKTVQPQ